MATGGNSSWEYRKEGECASERGLKWKRFRSCGTSILWRTSREETRAPKAHHRRAMASYGKGASMIALPGIRRRTALNRKRVLPICFRTG